MTSVINKLASEQQRAKLSAIRAVMQVRAVDAFCVPRADEYLGEYIPPHNERLHWLTDFTGSAGMAVVLQDKAAMFTDGRYTVQVRRQVDGSLYQYRHLVTEPALSWLTEELSPGAKVLIDPRMCTLAWYDQAKTTLGAAGLEIILSIDNPIDACWSARPEPLVAPALLLGASFTGETSISKRQRVGSMLRDAGAHYALIFAPDSVSWLLNVRGRDVPRLPVLLSFAVLGADGELQLVVDPRRVPDGFDTHVGPGVTLVDEADAATLLAAFSGKTVLADPDTASAWTQLSLQQGGAQLLSAPDPVLLPKACKNPVEVEGARRAHRRDAIAEIRFLAWLDREVAAGKYHNEAVLSERLGQLRSEVELYHEPSFDTISAAAANGAMCHYNHLNATPGDLQADSLYLVDSGGQYSDGTTDITRTVAIGTPSDDMRNLFTLVLKGHIALDSARFPPGTTGTHLDILARQFLWQTGRDYDHGTGHGVGAFLSVHEGPQRIAKAWNATSLSPGMIVSNEPGYYRDNEFGIRCENLCVVVDIDAPDQEVPMLGFEALTLVPFDRRLMELSLMSDAELDWVNRYHARVLAAAADLLDDVQDREWLQAATAVLERS
ncbi:MAG: M24 family metallopeptidase [Congregibacter sp.]